MTNEEFKQVKRENRRANRLNNHLQINNPCITSTTSVHATPRKDKILDLNDGTHFSINIIKQTNPPTDKILNAEYSNVNTYGLPVYEKKLPTPRRVGNNEPKQL